MINKSNKLRRNQSIIKRRSFGISSLLLILKRKSLIDQLIVFQELYKSIKMIMKLIFNGV